VPAVSNAWVSSDVNVATVSSSGLVTGILEGTTTITYTNNDGCYTTTQLTIQFAQPTQPTPINCWDNFVFNTTTCSWENTGSPAPPIVTNASACESYTWEANGQSYSTSGEYSFNDNCQDYILNLTINEPTASTLNATIIEGETY
jgi:uncharacterized protein YjdB